MNDNSIKIEPGDLYEYSPKNNKFWLDIIKNEDNSSFYLVNLIADAIYNIRCDKFITDNHSLLIDLIKDRDQSNVIIAKYLILNGTKSL